MGAWLRPSGVIINGILEFGLEIAIHDGIIQEIRASSHKPDPYVLSPAFVNAHSHLEYRGMLDQIPHPEYYEWIYELTRLKPLESPEFVREQCFLASRENRATGVAWIGEHSDRPGSAEAMVAEGLGGWIFQEVITSGSPDVASTIKAVELKLEDNRSQTDWTLSQTGESVRYEPVGAERIGSSLNPHAYFTVDRETLKTLGANGQPSSIHVAETVHESNFTRFGTGPLADRRRKFGVPFDVYGQSVVEVLDDLGVMRPGMQCVHCCDVNQNDIEILAPRGVTISHCPRSNIRLQCPTAPVREFLEAGITVGLGMDSPASGGKIDMFEEMRAALRVSQERGAPLTAEEVWRMATSEGYKSFGLPGEEKWDIYVGSKTPVFKIEVIECRQAYDLIQLGKPDFVSWL